MGRRRGPVEGGRAETSEERRRAERQSPKEDDAEEKSMSFPKVGLDCCGWGKLRRTESDARVILVGGES